MWGFEITGPSQWSFIECVSFFFFFFLRMYYNNTVKAIQYRIFLRICLIRRFQLSRHYNHFESVLAVLAVRLTPSF